MERHQTEIIEPSERPDLWALNLYLGERKSRLRLLSYGEVEDTVDRLAAQIWDAIPATLRQQMTFRAIPRGGAIVLGLLSYALKLNSEQIDTGRGWHEGPLALVDDCALTGYRFYSYYMRAMREPTPAKQREIHFFHLCSTPTLRKAILARETDVHTCLAPLDLRTIGGHTPKDKKDDGASTSIAAALATTSTIDIGDTGIDLGWDRYTTEQVEAVIFPWNEPSLPVVNPIAGSDPSVQVGWRLFPPHLIYKNRHGLDLPPRPPGQGERREWAAPGPLGYHWDIAENRLTLLQFERQESYLLTGWPAAVWRGAAAYGKLDTLLYWLSKRYSNWSGDEIKVKCLGTIDALIKVGLLEAVNRQQPTI